MYVTPGGQRFPEDGSRALDLDATELGTSYAYTDWFPIDSWPALAAIFRVTWDAAASGVTSYEIKGQGRGASPSSPAVDLRTTRAGTTTTDTEHAITDGGAHDYTVNLQTNDHVGYDFVRFGVKYTGAGAADDDAALIESVKGSWS